MGEEHQSKKGWCKEEGEVGGGKRAEVSYRRVKPGSWIRSERIQGETQKGKQFKRGA